MAVSELKSQKCVPCKGDQPTLPDSEANALLNQLSNWQFTSDRKGIHKELRMKDFSAAIEYMRKIADVANAQDHHPDLHLTGYRNLGIELSTHSIGGLSKNDFIMAAKIDELPKDLKQ